MVYQLFFEIGGSRKFYGEYRDIDQMLYFFNELMTKGAISTDGEKNIVQYPASRVERVEVICIGDI